MLPRAPSINTLARTLGLSRTTISDALRGKGRVSPLTIQRVRQAATAAGYRPNPLVAAVLGAIHHAHKFTVRGELAVVDIHEPDHPHGPYSRELIAGAKLRAAEMGFSIAEFAVGPAKLPWSRLHSILHSRGTHGVIVLPAWFAADLSALDWSRYAGIYTDYITTGLELHSVCPDHYGSMCSLLGLLRSRGYRRPGLLLEQQRDERIGRRQSAAFCAFQTRNAPADLIPPLIVPDRSQLEERFATWFAQHQPDIVLSHFPQTRDWIASAPARRSADLVLLNVLHQTFPSAALDLQPRILGARAVEMVVGQILRNEFGVPQWPSRTTVQAKWIEGPTVRPPFVREPACS